MLRVCSVLVLLLATPLSAETLSGPLTVVDGDTFRIGSRSIRLHGIDSPERGQRCTGAGRAAWDCGDWVARTVRARYAGRQARCAVLEEDRYGRAVARCEVGGVDVARQMVLEGLAFAYRKYSWDYDLEEKQAAVAQRGLHAVDVMEPEAWRARQREARAKPQAAPQAAAPGRCVIKGNINRRNERIYHEPGQRHYADTVITETRGERWFCSRAEAEAAGWRRAGI